MLSSISSVLGFYGQVNYAAANFFEDAASCNTVANCGLPATSVNLGVLGQYAGAVAGRERGQQGCHRPSG